MAAGKVQKDVDAVVKGRKLVIKNSILLPMYTVQLLDNTKVRIYRQKSFVSNERGSIEGWFVFRWRFLNLKVLRSFKNRVVFRRLL
jgi:hypothetical protein